MLIPKIIKVIPKEDYTILLTFENGDTKLFDVKPYLHGEWFSELKEQEIFNSVHLAPHGIEWANGQDIAPHELFEQSKNITIANPH